MFLIVVISACQTIKEKTDAIVEKENQEYGQYVGKEINKLKIDLGIPTESFLNEKGNRVFLYKTKKYGIPCERKFEINQNNTIESFSSSGCIWDDHLKLND